MCGVEPIIEKDFSNGKQPVKIFSKLELFKAGLKISLFSDIKPNNAAIRIALIAITFFLLLIFIFSLFILLIAFLVCTKAIEAKTRAGFRGTFLSPELEKSGGALSIETCLNPHGTCLC